MKKDHPYTKRDRPNRKEPVLDCVTQSLIENGIPLTQRNWIEAAY